MQYDYSLVCHDCAQYGSTWHSRDAFSCDFCGRRTNHWYRIGDLCACPEDHTRYVQGMPLDDIFTLGGR